MRRGLWKARKSLPSTSKSSARHLVTALIQDTTSTRGKRVRFPSAPATERDAHAPSKAGVTVRIVVPPTIKASRHESSRKQDNAGTRARAEEATRQLGGSGAKLGPTQTGSKEGKATSQDRLHSKARTPTGQRSEDADIRASDPPRSRLSRVRRTSDISIVASQPKLPKSDGNSGKRVQTVKQKPLCGPESKARPPSGLDKAARSTTKFGDPVHVRRKDTGREPLRSPAAHRSRTSPRSSVVLRQEATTTRNRQRLGHRSSTSPRISVDGHFLLGRKLLKRDIDPTLEVWHEICGLHRHDRRHSAASDLISRTWWKHQGDLIKQRMLGRRVSAGWSQTLLRHYDLTRVIMVQSLTISGEMEAINTHSGNKASVLTAHWSRLVREYRHSLQRIGPAAHQFRYFRRRRDDVRQFPGGILISQALFSQKLFELRSAHFGIRDGYAGPFIARLGLYEPLHHLCRDMNYLCESVQNTGNGLIWLQVSSALRNIASTETYRAMYLFKKLDQEHLQSELTEAKAVGSRETVGSVEAVIKKSISDDGLARLFLFQAQVTYFLLAIDELEVLSREWMYSIYQRSRCDTTAGIDPRKENRITLWLRQHRLQLAKGIEQERKDPKSLLFHGMKKTSKVIKALKQRIVAQPWKGERAKATGFQAEEKSLQNKPSGVYHHENVSRLVTPGLKSGKPVQATTIPMLQLNVQYKCLDHDSSRYTKTPDVSYIDSTVNKAQPSAASDSSGKTDSSAVIATRQTLSLEQARSRPLDPAFAEIEDAEKNYVANISPAASAERSHLETSEAITLDSKRMMPRYPTRFPARVMYELHRVLEDNPLLTLNEWYETCGVRVGQRRSSLRGLQSSLLWWRRQVHLYHSHVRRQKVKKSSGAEALVYGPLNDNNVDSKAIILAMGEVQGCLNTLWDKSFASRWRISRHAYHSSQVGITEKAHRLAVYSRNIDPVELWRTELLQPVGSSYSALSILKTEFRRLADENGLFLRNNSLTAYSMLIRAWHQARDAYDTVNNMRTGLWWLHTARRLDSIPAIEKYRIWYEFRRVNISAFSGVMTNFKHPCTWDMPSEYIPVREMTYEEQVWKLRTEELKARLSFTLLIAKEVNQMLWEYPALMHQRSLTDSVLGHSDSRRHALLQWLRQHKLRLARAIDAELCDPYSWFNRYNYKGLRRVQIQAAAHPVFETSSSRKTIASSDGSTSSSAANQVRRFDSSAARSSSSAEPDSEYPPFVSKPAWYSSSGAQDSARATSNATPPILSRHTCARSPHTKRFFSTVPTMVDSPTNELCSPNPHTPLSFTACPSALQALQLARANGNSTACWTYRLYCGPDSKPPLTHYCRTLAQSEEYAQLFLDSAILGFDLEWKPNTAAKGGNIKEGISTIQLASESHIAVFHLALHTGSTPEELVAPTLKRILEDSNIIKAGVSVLGDRTRLLNYLNIRISAAFELSHLYRLIKYSDSNPKLVNRVGVSLTTQCEEHLGLPLNKDEIVRGSDWSKPLGMEQVVYAASDAYVAVHLFDVMERIRRGMRPMPDQPEWAELKAERDALPKEPRTRRKTSEEVDEDELTGDLCDDGDYTPRMSTAATPATSSTPSSRRKPTPKRTLTPKTPQPPPTPELLLADAYIATLSPSSSNTLPPRIHRTHHLFHHQFLPVPIIARLLRTPPLANYTVASYIAEAVCVGGLDVDLERAGEVAGALGPGRAKRWNFVVEARRREGVSPTAAGAEEGERKGEADGEMDELAESLGGLNVQGNDGGEHDTKGKGKEDDER